MAKYEEHKFYCLLCGRAGIPLPRRKSFQHGAFHRKKLYCPYCKVEVNHIEIKNLEQEKKFLKNFENGVYKDEAEESLAACGGSRLGKEYMG